MGDATIDAIVERRPQDLQALARVHGIGPVKLERYGAALLDRIRGTSVTDSRDQER